MPILTCMPLYEFICRRCQKEFQAVQSLGEHDKARPACPRCKSPEQVEQELSPFFARTTRKA